MRTATTILNIIRQRGQRQLPLKRVSRLLYQPELYLRAYGKLARNKGALTPGVTSETVDGMSLEKIDKIIQALRAGGVCLKWNKWVAIDDEQQSRIWNGRSEVVQRLLAQKCELCGSKENIEVHHIRKLADLESKGRKPRPEWMKKMSARRRKTLVVCRNCHHNIQYGRYDGSPLKRKDYWKAT